MNSSSINGDLLDLTATQVRVERRGERDVHKVLHAQTVEPIGRQYHTGCHRYLYADEGAILTTDPVTCAGCNGTRTAAS